MDTATSALSAEGTAAAAAAANDASLALKVLFNNHLDLELPNRLTKIVRNAINTMAPSLADTTDKKLAELALRVLELEQRKEQHSDEVEATTRTDLETPSSNPPPEEAPSDNCPRINLSAQ